MKQYNSNNGSLVRKGSLQESQSRKGMTFAEAFIKVDAVLVVDISYSMNASDVAVDEAGRRTRHAEAQLQLEKLQRKFPGRLAVVAFSDRAEFCLTGVLPAVQGGTDLLSALQFVAPAAGCGIKFIVASDGEADDPQGTLDFAKVLPNKIDTIHIGNSVEGRKFLADLANATRGVSIDKGVDLLEESVTLLLQEKN